MPVKKFTGVSYTKKTPTLLSYSTRTVALTSCSTYYHGDRDDTLSSPQNVSHVDAFSQFQVNAQRGFILGVLHSSFRKDIEGSARATREIFSCPTWSKSWTCRLVSQRSWCHEPSRSTHFCARLAACSICRRLR